jgi:hypothetical protein
MGATKYWCGEPLEDYDMYKYVQMEDGTFRFTTVVFDHKALAEGGKVISAGTISTRGPGKFRVDQRGSQTLKIGYHKDDPPVIDDLGELSKALGRELEDKWS